MSQVAETPSAQAQRQPPEQAIAGDRTSFAFSGHLGGERRGKVLLLVALFMGSGAFLWATWDRVPLPPARGETPAKQVVPFEPGAAVKAASGPTQDNPGPNSPSLTGTDVPALEPSPADMTDEISAPSQAQPGRPAQLRPTPLLVYSRRGNAGTSPPGGLVPTSTSPSEAAPSELDGLRRSAPVTALRAGRLPDRNTLILAGAILPCVLRTALDSTTPGYVSCVIPHDIYSDNGAVVLLEKGARVLGEYRSASLKQGHRRIFVLWTRAVTPGGVAIPLASPAADGLGRSGFEGEVDRHFWDRFGGALLLSLVDDAAYAAAGTIGGTQVRLPSDAAAIAMQGSANIGPTLRKNPGAEVSIFVAHDLDFSGVYGLKATP